MLQEQKAYERKLIGELKQSVSKVLNLIEALEHATDEDEALDAYATLMAQALQVKLDSEALLEVNEEIMQLELEQVS
jgi:hypothetical protein